MKRQLEVILSQLHLSLARRRHTLLAAYIFATRACIYKLNEPGSVYTSQSLASEARAALLAAEIFEQEAQGL